MNKYKDSVYFIENFIKKKFKEIQNKLFKFKYSENDYIPKKEKREIPVIFKYFISSDNYKKSNDSLEDVQTTNMDRITNSLAFSHIKHIKDEANHVGFGFNNRDMIFVENNFINQSSIVSEIDESINHKKYSDIFSSKIMLRKNFAKFDMERNNLKTPKNLKNNILNDKSIDNNKLKRNLFLSYNKKKFNSKNKKNNLFLLPKRSFKNKLNLKTPKSTNRTINNSPKFPIAFDKSINIDNNNNEDEFNEIYVPKYPRPAILSDSKNERKNISYTFNSENNEKNDKENHKNINFFGLGKLDKKKFHTIFPLKIKV